MNNYREKLRNQNIVFVICAVSLAVVLILACMGIIEPIEGDESWHEYWNGMIVGLSFSVISMMIFGIVKNILALKNTKKLEKLYIEENDERKLIIAEKGKSAGASVFLVCMPVAMIISGFFSITVCITCLVMTFSLSLAMILGKVYYMKKM